MPPELQVIALGSCLVEMTPRETGRDLTAADEYLALPSGAASNFVIALARLGIATGFITRVGDDELGQWLLARLNGFGVATEGLARSISGQLTPVSFCWMDRAGAKRFYFYRFPGYCDPMATLQAEELSSDTLRRARIFDFSEAVIRKQPLRDAVLQAAENARAAGQEIVYAVNYRPGSWQASEDEIAHVQNQAIAVADIVLMNREEAALFTGKRQPADAAAEVAALGPGLVAITDGANGAYVYGDGSLHAVAARQVRVTYDIGAGDTFHAGLVAAYLRGLQPAQIGRFAADAAALRITRSADMEGLPTWDEVEQLTREAV